MDSFWTEQELKVIEDFEHMLESDELSEFADDMVRDKESKYGINYNKVQKIMFFTSMVKGPKNFRWEFYDGKKNLSLILLDDSGRFVETMDSIYSYGKLNFSALKNSFINSIVKNKWKVGWGTKASEMAAEFLTSSNIELLEEK